MSADLPAVRVGHERRDASPDQQKLLIADQRLSLGRRGWRRSGSDPRRLR